MEILNTIAEELKDRIHKHKGLSTYSDMRKCFEQWIQVEICDILSFSKLKNGIKIECKSKLKNDKGKEKYIDLIFDDCALELKVISNKQNDGSIFNDICRLKDSDKLNKGVLFVIYPVDVNADDNSKLISKDNDWLKKYEKLNNSLPNLKYLPFTFQNNETKGAIGYGLFS